MGCTQFVPDREVTSKAPSATPFVPSSPALPPQVTVPPNSPLEPIDWEPEFVPATAYPTAKIPRSNGVPSVISAANVAVSTKPVCATAPMNGTLSPHSVCC